MTQSRQEAYLELGWPEESRPDGDCVFFACPGDVAGAPTTCLARWAGHLASAA